MTEFRELRIAGKEYFRPVATKSVYQEDNKIVQGGSIKFKGMLDGYTTLPEKPHIANNRTIGRAYRSSTSVTVELKVGRSMELGTIAVVGEKVECLVYLDKPAFDELFKSRLFVKTLVLYFNDDIIHETPADDRESDYRFYDKPGIFVNRFEYVI